MDFFRQILQRDRALFAELGSHLRRKPKSRIFVKIFQQLYLWTGKSPPNFRSSSAKPDRISLGGGLRSPSALVTLASCLIYAWTVPAHPLPVATRTEMGSDQSAVRSWQGSDLTANWSLPISVLVWVRSFIETDLFENNVPFGNTTPIYLINLL